MGTETPSACPYDLVFYAFCPGGTAHRVTATTYNERRSIGAFARNGDIHGFTVQPEAYVRRAIDLKIYAVFAKSRNPQPIQYAFENANGRIVDHSTLAEFYAAIGMTPAARAKIKANRQRIRRVTRNNMWADTTPFQVRLTVTVPQ